MSIKELRINITNKDIPVSNLLREAKIIATEYEMYDFVLWIDKELNGYKEEDTPSYRIMKGIIKGLNPYNGWIPISFQDNNIQESVSKMGTRQPIGQLEELLKNSKDNILRMKYSSDKEKIIREAIGYQTEIALFIDSSQVYSILEYDRNYLLEKILSIKDMEEKKSIGILNKGKNNKFIDNSFVGLDVGIQDEGEETYASGNKFLNNVSHIEKIEIIKGDKIEQHGDHPKVEINKENKKEGWFSMSKPLVYFLVLLVLYITYAFLNYYFPNFFK